MKTMHIYSIIFCVMACLWPFSMCKAQEKSSLEPKGPAETYDPFVEEPAVSTLTIPIRITKSELNKMIDAKLTGPIYEDYSYDDQGGDGLQMNLWKNGAIAIEVYTNTIKYKIPLKYWLKKKLYIGEAESEGCFEIGFKTTYSLNPDWTLSTTTVTEYHNWTKPPVVKTGWGDITIEWIANMLLNRSKSEVATEIDKAVRENLNVRQSVMETWVALQSPTLLDSVYQMWLKVTPKNIVMTPLYTEGDAIVSKIGVDCITDVTFGQEPRFRANHELPPLQKVEYLQDDAFRMHVITDMSFGEAERLANMTMKDYVLEAGGKKIKVDALNLFGNGDQLVVKSTLSGDFKGNIYFKGRPEFNSEKVMIEMKDFDYDLETKNFLHRTASWLFSGPIKKKMEESMTFPLDENLWAMRTSIQEVLNHYQIAEGIVCRGKIATLKVEKTALTKGGFRIVINAEGTVQVDVENL